MTLTKQRLSIAVHGCNLLLSFSTQNYTEKWIESVQMANFLFPAVFHRFFSSLVHILLFAFVRIHFDSCGEIHRNRPRMVEPFDGHSCVHILLARPPRTTSSMLKCLYICLKYFCILNDDASNFLLFRRYFSVGSARLFMLLLLLFRAPVCVCVSAWHTIPFIRLVCLFA